MVENKPKAETNANAVASLILGVLWIWSAMWLARRGRR
jgi:hypothetical protein